MDDTRIALVSGTKLFFGKEQSITIQEVIGCGASCFVYNATYQDSRGLLHNVRIKECYPYGILLERKDDNSLSVLSDEMEKFERAKEQFFQAYERNAKIKRISELLNSTGTVSEIVQANGTLYSMLSYEEGQDYQQYQDVSLQEVLEHIKAVAQVIQKYHENGYLHLDIKPKNIFVFPETAQHILLFDFDSVIRMEELTNGNFRLAVSDGFSAPEQLQGKLDKIGVTTDIYALGAVLFYKIFGRTPTLHDCNLDATYNFSNMIYKDERYQPKLYKGLEVLFRKSICISSMARWKDMRLFIAQIEQLLPLADPTIVFVQENFSYHSNCFVGRSEYLEELQNILEEKKVVFLSGIGGIGKTELAKRYAYLNQEEYDRIIFISFSNSVEETICSNDILIQNEAWEENSTESLFESRMRVMKKDLTGNDLFILDNFDVDKDDNLEYLLECRCKFIITSRNDFRDYNYPQMNIDKIEDEEEVLELFSAYNQRDYSQEEWKTIRYIMQLVDNHTMTVELIAKYLRDIQESPSWLLKKLMEKEGITSLQEMEVKHRKDKKMSVENINTHLLILFHLSNFSNDESELMRSLSLLGYLRILRSSFLEYCNVTQKEECLEHLIKTGWIEYNEETEKISLHQIILDLVYNHMKPTAENCVNFVETIGKYFLEEVETNVERENKRKLFKSIMQRLKGNSLEYAKLCVLYQGVVHTEDIYLEVAEKICMESEKIEAKNLLYQISKWKIDIIGTTDYFFVFGKNYRKNQVKKLLEMTERALQYSKEYSLDKVYQAEVLVEIGKELSDFKWRLTEWGLNKNKQDIQCLSDRINELCQEAELLILNSSLSNKRKEKLFEQMRNFYGDAITLQNNFISGIDIGESLNQAYHYQNLLASVKEKSKDNVIDIYAVTSKIVADMEYQRKNYKKALKYYEQVLIEGDINVHYETILEYIADIYQKQCKFSKAIKYLKKSLKINKQKMIQEKECSYRYGTCCQLLQLLSVQNRKIEVKLYANELIEYALQEFQKQKESYSIQWLIVGYYKLYSMEQEKETKQIFWKKCLEYFSMLNTEEKLFDEIFDFLLGYVKIKEQENAKQEKVQNIFQLLECMGMEWHANGSLGCDPKKVKIFLYELLSICKNDTEMVEYYIKVLVYLSIIIRYEYPEKALKYGKKAFTLWKKSYSYDKYLKSLVYDALIESYFRCQNYSWDYVEKLQKHCNYYLIAKIEEKGKSLEKQWNLWTWAVSQYSGLYSSLDRYEEKKHQTIMYIKCLERMMELVEKTEYSSYWCFSDDYREFIFPLYDAYVEIQEIQKLKVTIFRVFQIVIKNIYNNMNENINLEDHYKDIYNMGEVLENAECVEEALLFYIISIYVGIVLKPMRVVLESVLDRTSDSMQLLINAFQEAIHRKMTSWQIDMVIETYEKMKPLLEYREDYVEVKKELKWFSTQYQKQEIEFKREE